MANIKDVEVYYIVGVGPWKITLTLTVTYHPLDMQLRKKHTHDKHQVSITTGSIKVKIYVQ